MRFLIWLFLFCTTLLKGQKSLVFDHRFVECENRWVALAKDNDSVLDYGFIYIDSEAGLTLNYEGSFTIQSDGKFVPKKSDKVIFKYRLQPNNIKVALIPFTKFDELEISKYPDWLKFYLDDPTSLAHLYRWGFLYNSYNECSKALTYLEKARLIDSKYEGLEVELAFSYNCLNMFDKAADILTGALEANPTNAYFYKKLIYSQIQLGKLDKASDNCKKAISVCTDNSYNGEMCYNLLHTFFLKKDKEKFNLWVEETKKWTSHKSDLINSIKSMETELQK